MRSKRLLFGILITILLFSGCAGAPETTTPTEPETITDTTPPAEVIRLAATPGNQKVILTWREPSDTDFAKVEILYDDLSTPIEVIKGNTTTEVTGLTQGVEYTFTIKTVDTAGNKSAGAKVTSIPFPYESLDYFPITEGYGIKYHVTDDYDGLDCNVWAVSQYFEAGKPDKLAFVFTLTKEGTQGGYFRNSSLGGDVSRSIDGGDLTCFVVGWPVGNQANFYFSFSLPRMFSLGDEWTIRDKKYRVEYVGAQTVNGIEFKDCIKDCIKVTIDDSLNKSEYLKGNGYFILARDVGIIKLVFSRTNGKNVLYEYAEHKQLTRHTISGTINDGGVPVKGIIVQISGANWGIRSVNDSDGAFSIQAYGPDIILRIGYDKDNDDAFEFDGNYPKEYCVNNITSDIIDLSIDVSAL